MTGYIGGTTPMPDDVSSRILAAATLAEQAATKATPGPWSQDAFYVVGQTVEARPGGEVIVQCLPTRDGMSSYPSRYPYGPQSKANAHLIAASGPPHWGAVAEGLRDLMKAHPVLTYTMSGLQACDGCWRYKSRLPWPCASVAALLPLVDQIIRDLGDGQNG